MPTETDPKFERSPEQRHGTTDSVAQHKALLVFYIVLMAGPFLFFLVNFKQMKDENIILTRRLVGSGEVTFSPRSESEYSLDVYTGLGRLRRASSPGAPKSLRIRVTEESPDRLLLEIPLVDKVLRLRRETDPLEYGGHTWYVYEPEPIRFHLSNSKKAKVQVSIIEVGKTNAYVVQIRKGLPAATLT